MNESSHDVALPFAALRRFARPEQDGAKETCDFCSVFLNTRHRHLLEVARQKLWCVCDPCALRFENTVAGRFKLVPRDAMILSNFHMTDEQWNGFALPINLAFFFKSTCAEKVVAMFPSPGGSMESLLTFQDWTRLGVENPALETMQADVEALLVNRIGQARDHFITPIDMCHELSGLVRIHWRGLSGGDRVWNEIERFFQDLRKDGRHAAEPDYAQA